MEERFKGRSVAIHLDEDLVVVGFQDGSLQSFEL